MTAHGRQPGRIHAPGKKGAQVGGGLGPIIGTSLQVSIEPGARVDGVELEGGK